MFEMVTYLPRILTRENHEKPQAALNTFEINHDQVLKDDAIRDTELLLRFPRSVLIGEQGSGKTHILKALETNARLYVDLERFTSIRQIEKELEQKRLSEYILLFDSLERFTDIDGFIAWVEANQSSWKGFLIASRSWAWKSRFAGELNLSQISIQNKNNKPDTLKSTDSIWNCDLIDRHSLAAALGEQYQTFSHKVHATGQDLLLNKALDAFILLEYFKQHQTIPESLYEYLDYQVRQQTEQLKMDSKTLNIHGDKLVDGLKDLALIQTFSESLNIKEHNLIHFLNQTFSAEEAAQLLQSQLLVKREDNILFFHSFYRELLCAQSLAAQPLFFKVKQLLFHDFRVVPTEYRMLVGFCLTLQSLAGETRLARFLQEKQDDTMLLILLDQSRQLPKLLGEDYIKTAFDYLTEHNFPAVMWADHHQNYAKHLKYHRPEDPQLFLAPYFEKESRNTVNWACLAAQAWGVLDFFQNLLQELLFRPDVPITQKEVLFNYVDFSVLDKPVDTFEAFLNSSFFEPAQKLSKALSKVHQLQLPPALFFEKVFQIWEHPDWPENEKSLQLLNVGRKYADRLDRNGLEKALAYIESHFQDFKGKNSLINGFIHHARTLNYPLSKNFIFYAFKVRDASIYGYLESQGLKQSWQRLLQASETASVSKEQVLTSWLSQAGASLIPILKELYSDKNSAIPNTDWSIQTFLETWLIGQGYRSQRHDAEERLQFIKQHYPDFEFTLKAPYASLSQEEVAAFIQSDDSEGWLLFDLLNEHANNALCFDGVEILRSTHKTISSQLWHALIEKCLKILKNIAAFTSAENFDIFSQAYLAICIFYLKYPDLIPEDLKCLPLEDIAELVATYLDNPGSNTLLFTPEIMQYLYTHQNQRFMGFASRILTPAARSNGKNACSQWASRILGFFRQRGEQEFVEQITAQLKQFQFIHVGDLTTSLDYLQQEAPAAYVALIDQYHQKLPDYLKAYTQDPSINPYWDQYNNPQNLKHFLDNALFFRGLQADLSWAWRHLEENYLACNKPFVLDIHQSLPYPASEHGRVVFERWLLDCLQRKEALYRNENEKDLLTALRDTVSQLLTALNDTGYSLQYLTALRERQLDPVIKTEIQYLLLRSTQKATKATDYKDLLSVRSNLTSAKLLDISEDNQLYEFTKELLYELQSAYFDQGIGTQAFWRTKISATGTETLIPQTEPVCQNALHLHLSLMAAKYGYHIEVDRESLVADNWQDFRLTVAKPEKKLLIPIEVKVAHQGKGRSWLIQPIEDQLFQEYMAPQQRRKYGIFLTLWFKCPEFKYPTVWETKSDYLQEAQAFAQSVSARENVEIAALLLDLTESKPQATEARKSTKASKKPDDKTKGKAK